MCLSVWERERQAERDGETGGERERERDGETGRERERERDGLKQVKDTAKEKVKKYDE